MRLFRVVVGIIGLFLGGATVVSSAMGEKILVVEDVVTKGERVQETLDIIRAHRGETVAVAVAVDRSNGAVEFGRPLFSLISLQVETFEPTKLPPDLAAIPAIKPGSK